MAQETTFQTLYRRLNKEQKKAVDAIEGPVMVIAGPGTGKTQILTLRIANILRKTDTPPDSILALTFTESGVYSMRKRLVEIIGSAGYRVHINTFHSFCNDIIQSYPSHFPDIIGARHISEVDKILLVRDIIRTGAFRRLKPFGNIFYYLEPVIGKISELKREHVSPKEFRKRIRDQKKAFSAIGDLVHEKGPHKGKMKGKYRTLKERLEKHAELCTIYEVYEHELTKRREYDFDDMIGKTIQALERSSDLLLSLQETFQYILADEHQDANNSQNRLLELLASYHEHPNLFIVGDEKQAIFRFQGASGDNFSRFRSAYPGALIVTLTDNYRSRQAILDAAHSVIVRGSAARSQRLLARSARQEKDDVPILLGAFSKADHEYLYIADDIGRKLAAGMPPEEVAVIYRTNRDAEGVSRILEKKEIPFVVESDQNVLTDTDIRKLVILLRTLTDPGNETALAEALHIDFLGFDPLDLYRIIRYCADNHLSIRSALKSHKHLAKAAVDDAGPLKDFYRQLSRWETASHNQSPLELLERLSNESGFLDHLLSLPDASDKVLKLSGFFDHLGRIIEQHPAYVLADIIAYLDLLGTYRLSIKKATADTQMKAVRLMTAHKAKGLEFDVVYLIDVHDGHWGNRRSVSHFGSVIADEVAIAAGSEEDDERRLFYVALTRAREGVLLSYAEEGQDGKHRLPSQFIEEIDKRFLKEIDVAPFEKTVRPETLLRPTPASGASLSDKTYLNELFLSQGLSVTALNSYLRCPWQYFYNNLLRLPKAPSKHQQFGTAIHRTLKDFFEKGKEGEELSGSDLVALFRLYAQRLPLPHEEAKEVLKKGEQALRGYHRRYRNSWNFNTLSEFKAQTLFTAGETGLPPIILRGYLDKVEFLGPPGEVNVVDYKTGKPKSRKELEKRETKSGDYKRQLVFYRLLLDLHDDGAFSMQSGEIDFVEPDSRGIYHKEKFFIEDEDVVELKQVVRTVAADIFSLAFWNTTCADAACPYCRMRASLGKSAKL